MLKVYDAYGKVKESVTSTLSNTTLGYLKNLSALDPKDLLAQILFESRLQTKALLLLLNDYQIEITVDELEQMVISNESSSAEDELEIGAS